MTRKFVSEAVRARFQARRKSNVVTAGFSRCRELPSGPEGLENNALRSATAGLKPRPDARIYLANFWDMTLEGHGFR